MLHFTPHKRPYKAIREEKMGGGIGEARVLSDQISTSFVAIALINATQNRTNDENIAQYKIYIHLNKLCFTLLKEAKLCFITGFLIPIVYRAKYKIKSLIMVITDFSIILGSFRTTRLYLDPLDLVLDH
jgi:hypothetical protein